MSSHIFQRYAFLVFLFFILVWAWLNQADTYMNFDTGWFLEATERMLAGGNYANDFFENNPPWILYLTIPPVIFAKTFSINLTMAMRLYVFSFAIISLGLSYYFLLKIFAKSDVYLARLLTIVLAFLFLVLPSFEFGQRENLFFILSMPYLLMMEQRLQDRNVNFYLAVFVGLLGGLVFILKPYFLMTLFLVEFYYLIRKKNLKVVIRPETLTILALLIAYIVIIGLYHRDYLAVVLPIAARYCYFGSRHLWSLLFFSQFCTVCYIFLLFCLISYKLNRYKSLTVIFLLAWLGFFFSYAIQQEDVYYRLLPVYAMSILMFMLAFASYASTPIKYHPVYLWIMYFALVVFIYLKKTTYLLDYYPLFHPMLSLVFVTTIFLMVLYLLQKNVKFTMRFYARFLTLFLLISCFVYGLFYYINLTEFYALFVNLLIIVIYGCLIPSNNKNKIYYISFIFVACVMVLLPFFQFLAMLEIAKNNKKDFVKLVNYINDNIPQKSYYFISTTIPNFLEFKANNASRFSFYWLLPGLVKQTYQFQDNETYKQYQKDKKFFIDMVAEDLAIKKPEWIFVDKSTLKSYLFWRTVDRVIPVPFDYLIYFNDNEKFKDVWKNYRYSSNIKYASHVYLNPYQYELQLNFKHVPDESTIQFRSLYLYVNSNNHIEIAFKDNNRQLRRMEVSLDENQLRGMRYALTTPGAELERRDKMILYKWILKQSIEVNLYSYDLYHRKK